MPSAQNWRPGEAGNWPGIQQSLRPMALHRSIVDLSNLEKVKLVSAGPKEMCA